ncbi:hypothetical protein K440DRAFT_602251 [Wilcoxina mikolae CBS 423.85]|nr:hypothetical protein K440DRAFT_602251 [Wilcoxina mikolae CBS 423.85]
MNLLASLLLLASTVIATPASQRAPGIQHVLSAWKDSPLAAYPTDFTRGILPKRIHSHNDYWRNVPLYSAIAVGAISIEADVWLYNETLYIGHDTSSLSPNRTFDSLYIQPLVGLLQRQNPRSAFVPQDTRNGVFDQDAGQTLFLWVDVKTSGTATWPYVVRALEPLRSRGYLTKLTPDGINMGPITVIGTGGTPLELVAPVKSRDYFYDGPLLSLAAQNITKEISPIASTQLSAAVGEVGTQGLNKTQVKTVEELVAEAIGRGIQVRFWDLPGWPVSTRNAVWKQIMDAGVYLVNADDLQAAAGVSGTGAEW